MRTTPRLLTLVAFCLSAAAWAHTPFDGTWRLNTAKSNLAGDTMSFADAGSGQLKYTDSNESYTFKPDGAPFTTPLGLERTFKRTADNVYISTSKTHGFLRNTSTWTVATDGTTLVVEVKGTKPNADTFDNRYTYARTSPGTGLLGGWKSTEIKLSSPNALTFETAGSDVIVTIAAIKASSHAKWDGKDYPATGPTVTDGLTIALTRIGPNSFKLVQKSKGKVLDIISFDVAADGKSMQARGTNGEGKEPYSELWEKQL